MARRFKTATCLNLFGLVVTYASCYLLLSQIIYQYTYNRSVDDYQQLYRMESNFLNDDAYTEHICRPFAEGLKSLSQVESYSLVWNQVFSQDTCIAIKGEEKRKYLFSCCNNTGVSALTSHVLDGRIEWNSDNQDGIIIPATIAEEYFGTTRAADSLMFIIRDGNETTYRVVGVYKDFPKNCELTNCIYYNMGEFDLYFLYAGYKCYVKLAEGHPDLDTTVNALKRAAIDSLIANAQRAGLDEKDINNTIGKIKKTDFKLIPLRDSYFEFSSFTTGDHGYRGMLTVLELACLLVIIISTVNFLNFTLAMSPMRIRGLNTRLVLGAYRSRLRSGVIAECILTSLFACLLAIGIASMLEHGNAAKGLFEYDFALSQHWLLVVIMLMLSIVVGTVVGIYPAIFATSFEPALVLKSSFGLTPQGKRLRATLIFIQLCASMFMITYIGLLFQQNRYIYNSSYGYNKNQVLFCATTISSDSINLNTRDEICQSLKQNPSIRSVSLSSGVIGSTDSHYNIQATARGHSIGYNFMYTDPDYLSTLGIDIIKGRSFNPNDSAVVIVTESAFRQWNGLHIGDKVSTSPEETTDSATIIGVCKDIRYGTMFTNNSQPYAFILDDGHQYIPEYQLNICVESTANQDTVIQEVSELLKKHGINSTPVCFNDILKSVYHKELLFFRIIYFLSIICIIITLIGLFCLTMFETEYRRKEIGIRKISGATTAEIIMMLCRQYVPLVLLSFVLAAPLAFYFYQRTMEPFSQHAETNWWMFPLSFVLVGAITLATVVLKSWNTACEDPSESLNSE